MKRQIFQILIALPMILLIETFASQAQNHICIDPGHGGPGAWQYGPNGDNVGTYGPVFGLSEQWVNIEVAYELAGLLTAESILCDLTRIHDTIHVPLAARADFADSIGASHFICIHHNGGSPSTQGTEVYWCDTLLEVDGFWRDTDSLLAKKILLRLLETWDSTGRYSDRCYGRMDGRCKHCGLKVLRETWMVSAYPEASFLSDPVEEALFDDVNSGHMEEEAAAIFNGIMSYIEEAGIAVIRNSYSSGTGGNVFVDGQERASPFERCWRVPEYHELEAYQSFYNGGYEYTFDHWAHVDDWTGTEHETYSGTFWQITVDPEFDYHTYAAYYRGGVYRCEEFEHTARDSFQVSETIGFAWLVSPGADTTTRVQLRLDRNGGLDGFPEVILDDLYYNASGNWTVSGGNSDDCRLKMIAGDRAGNVLDTILPWQFAIVPCVGGIDAPGSPGTFSCGSSFRIEFHWDSVASVDGYNVYRDSVLIAVKPATTLTHTDHALNWGQTYLYEVEAYVGECTSLRSGPIPATPSGGTPVAPTNLQIISLGDCVWRATWEDNSNNEDKFELRIEWYDEYWTPFVSTHTRLANFTQVEFQLNVDNTDFAARVYAVQQCTRCGGGAPPYVWVESSPSNVAYFTSGECPSDGCPVLFTYDGNEFNKENTLLALSQRKIGEAVSMGNRYLIDNPMVPGQDGLYRLRIAESEDDISKFDAVRLIGLSYPQNKAVGLKTDGNPSAYTVALKPSSCTDHQGLDILDLVSTADRRLYASEGKGYLIAEFTDLSAAFLSKPTAIVPGGGGDPGDKDDIPEMEKPNPNLTDLLGRPGNMLTIDALNADGRWEYITEIPPRARHTGLVFFDLPTHLLEADQLTLRYSWEHRYTTDQIALYHLDPDACLETAGLLLSATDLEGRSLKNKLTEVDSVVATLHPGQAWDLTFGFGTQEPFAAFVLESYGHYNPS